ncbi:MAG TPA: SUMF1/EgtB/PvdO family nonheme iron enzyme [Xanthobacteraceae bacterium]
MSSLDNIPRGESERRLAAILVADVVGYSRLMQADEDGTLSRVEEIGASIIEPSVAAHRGHIFRTMGDGLLIEFPSVVEAVLCAAEIQEELRQKGDAELPEQRIQLRIGINIGDIIRKENDVFGTGVNIAARLESLADPGSIYISGEAYDQVRDRPFAFDDLGMKAVKNIARLVRVYRVRPGEAARASTSAIPWRVPIGRRSAAVVGSIIGVAIIVAVLVLALTSLRQTTTSTTLATPIPETPNGSDEMSAWAKVKRSDRIDELSSYLDRFPNSPYSEYVRHRLNALRSHPEITKFRDCVDCPEMVVIPPGSYTMGIPQTEIDRYGFHPGASAPLHPVRIAKPFALGEFLVTRKQYAAFAAETGRQGSGCAALPLDGASGWKFDPALSWRDPGFAQSDNHPVVCVSWDDATAYASWLGKKTGEIIACRAKPNGNTRLGRAILPAATSAAHPFVNLPMYVTKVRRNYTLPGNFSSATAVFPIRLRSAAFLQTVLAFTTCSGTSGNGLKTAGAGPMSMRRSTARPVRTPSVKQE